MAISTEEYSRKFASAYLKALENVDSQRLKKIHEDLVSLTILSTEPLKSFFLNPVFHQDEKKKVLEEIFSQHSFQNETKQFVETLLSLDKLELMGTVAQDFAAELRQKDGEVKVELSTAYPLSTEEVEKIQATFKKAVGKKILLDITVNRELIGGIRANVGGVVYDSSIQGHLLRLQKEFSL